MNKKLPIFFALVLVVSAITFFYLKSSLLNDESANAISPASGAQAVSTMEVKTETIALSNILPGRVSASRQSEVRPQVNGIITKRLFEEGAQVEKGQQLYQIDAARYKALLVSAEADLKGARSIIESIKSKNTRYKELVKIDAVSRQEYEDVKAQLDQANASVSIAKAAVTVAQVNLDYTKVYAPISGRVGRSLMTEGALVTANQEQPMTIITQMDPVYIDMQQSSGEVMKYQRAQLNGQENIPVTIMLGQNGGMSYEHEGSLKFSEVTIDETTGSITLRAIVPNPDNILMPGLFVHASLSIGDEKALLVPQRSATRNPDGSLNVWVVDNNNKAELRDIKVSDTYQDNWIVTEGLSAGEIIIIEGYQKVKSGADVAPTPWIKATKKTASSSKEISQKKAQQVSKETKEK